MPFQCAPTGLQSVLVRPAQRSHGTNRWGPMLGWTIVGCEPRGSPLLADPSAWPTNADDHAFISLPYIPFRRHDQAARTAPWTVANVGGTAHLRWWMWPSFSLWGSPTGRVRTLTSRGTRLPRASHTRGDVVTLACFPELRDFALAAAQLTSDATVGAPRRDQVAVHPA